MITGHNIRICFLFFLSVLTLKSFSQTPAAEKYPGVAVIELFTSQGDINCPPADKLLSEIIADAQKNNMPVYCLSMHVDFWNRFGWKDPFSSFQYTNRLKNYTSVLGMKETYTPFMLLNGRNVIEGTDYKKAAELINKELAIPAKINPVFTWEIFDDTLDVSYDVKIDKTGGKAGSDKYINIAIVEKGLSTKVEKGDNAGKILINDNVARLFYTADLKSSKALIRVPLKSQKTGKNKRLILFIQDKSTRRVLGAASSEFLK